MSMRFIQARNFTPAPAGRQVDLLVIHTMENAEKPGTAAQVARWFESPQAPKASAHYCIDAGEVVQCVREQDVAWAAPGANRNGIHLEHAGRAAQSADDWQDDYSQRMLERSAELVAKLCAKYSIPVRKLTPEDLVAGLPGICGHVEVSKAFKKSTHTDPGKNFPWEQYLERVLHHLQAGAS